MSLTLERVREIACLFEDDPAYGDDETRELLELTRLAEERLLLEQMSNFAASHGQRWHFNGATEDTLSEAIRKAAGGER